MKTQDIKNMARALQQVQEKLTGNQHKLDMDKDGDIDAKDFKHMRKKKKSEKEEITMNSKVEVDKTSSTEEQKESTGWKIYNRILEKRDAHYKGATKPETMDDKLKGDGAKKMKSDYDGNTTDPDFEEKGHDDATKAGQAGPSKKARPGDNPAADKMEKPKDTTKG